MPRLAIIAALEREVGSLLKNYTRVQRKHEGQQFVFFEAEDRVIVCGGIGPEPARRAAEAAISLYRPASILSVGFAGALDARLRVGDIFTPGVVVDARDGSRINIEAGTGVLLTFMTVAGANQKAALADSYGAQAVDMEAAAVAAAARAHAIQFGAIKVISDESTFEMPETARFIDARGRFRTLAFAAFAALRPWLWPRVGHLARNSGKAAKALGEYLRAIAPHPIAVSEARTR